jgi:molybdopterin-guanine dinucleotide biosynthesis protein A
MSGPEFSLPHIHKQTFILSTSSPVKPLTSKTPNLEICILAGGLSERMGSDKSRLRLGSRTMLQQIRSEAKQAGVPVRVIKHDLVPRCGPLGGVYTALKRTRAEAVLFLACDMPFVQADLITWTLNQFEKSRHHPRKPSTESPTRGGLFLSTGRAAGFPFILPKTALPIVCQQIETGLFSIQNLAKTLKAKILTAPLQWRVQLRNVNTPRDWEQARKLWPKLNYKRPQR